MKWYKEHWRLTVISVVLLVLVTLTLLSYVNQGSQSWLGKRIESLSAFVQEPVSNGGNAVAETIRGLFQFRNVLEENEQLEAENAKLREEIVRLTLSQNELTQLEKLSASLNYISPEQSTLHVSATVIGLDDADWYHIFTINEGSDRGIVKDAIVINADGLIGRILEVGPNWSKVISIIDENNDVSFQIYRNANLLGILSGDGSGGLSGYMLDAEAAVIKGDTLITSGMELYPQGIPIGTIKEIKNDKDALLKRVTVTPVVDFTSVRKVTVVVETTQGVEE